MNRPESVPQAIWDTLTPEAQGFFSVVIGRLEGRIADLVARLDLNSHNSSKPPSSDPIHRKRQPTRSPSGKKRGGQPGHRRATRPLVPPEQLHNTIPCKPTACAGCGQPLDGSDPSPRRHQVAEVPPIRPEVLEYQLHRLACSHCGVSTRASLPDGVPRGGFGPRLHALLSLLAAEFRLAKRPVRRLAKNVLGLDISLGMIAKLERQTATVLQPVDDALAQAVRSAPRLHVDETPWREANGKAWMWVGIGPNVTHFRISRHRDGPTARQILGDNPEKVVVCDRFSAYGWVKKKQWCWAHLRRDFQAMIDRDDGGSELGKRLLKLSDNLFWGWHRQACGELTRPQWLEWANSIRERVHQELSQGASCPSRKTAATCRQLLEGEEHLWRFVEVVGVEPTNNTAERALRHGVLWRRSSGGTASVAGSQFVSRLLGMVATCRQQGRLVLSYLTSCLEASLRGQTVPMLC